MKHIITIHHATTVSDDGLTTRAIKITTPDESSSDVRSQMETMLNPNKDKDFQYTADEVEIPRNIVLAIVKTESQTQEKPILSENEAEIFNAYLKSEGICHPFGNSDWDSIYDKIVGPNKSEWIKRIYDSTYE